MTHPDPSSPAAISSSSTPAPQRRVLRPRALLLLAALGAAISAPLSACSGDSAAPDGGGGADGVGTGASGAVDGGGAQSGTGSTGSGTGGSSSFEGACSPGLPEASDVPTESDVTAPTAPISPYLVIDQFGYLPASEKIAVARDPEVGADSAESFTPGGTYRLMNAVTNTSALEGTRTPWNAGATDAVSGDKAYWFDFSSVTEPGVYYVLDVDQDVRSDLFRIAPDVYREVLKQAVRTFFYQRAGFEKTAEFAGEDWADGASHIGAQQDTEARLYSRTGDASTARDLSGGWYDAGDYNKYTTWTASYVIEMLRAYSERPEAFGDDYNIPESGNCIADIVDEARFGLVHLTRLQEADGSVLSIVDLDHASPPSSATGPSTYGPASTNATLQTAAAFAWGARIFAAVDADFSAALLQRAKDAFAWAEANPGVTFRNNEGAATGVGAGQQEPDAWVVKTTRLAAALALYRATGDGAYKAIFETDYLVSEYALFAYGWISGWSLDVTDMYLDYVELPDADATVRSAILTPFNAAMTSDDNLGMLSTNPDPYLAHQKDYGWGSNAQKSRIGSLFYSYVGRDLDQTKSADGARAAARYVHYLHGVNPFSLVYLSQMQGAGAHQSVTEFYHTWFADGSAWDTNPAPGFLTGGPNSGYKLDGACPGNMACPPAAPSPPFGQPPMKSYAQFNDNWPVNSWEVTENSNGYQLAYIRLLSKFVD